MKTVNKQLLDAVLANDVLQSVLLLRGEINSNVIDEKSGLTLLGLAVERSNLALVEALIMYGADVNGVYHHKSKHLTLNGFLHTCLLGNAELLRLLMQSKASSIIEDFHCHYSTTAKSKTETHDALMLAIQSGSIDTVELLLNTGFAFEGKDYDYIVKCMSLCDIEMLKLLCKHNIDLGYTNNTANRNTPLMLATQYDFIEGIHFLCQLGIEVDKQDEDGFAALHYAVELERTNVARALIQNGANLEIRTNQGYLPKQLARLCGMDDIHDLLLSYN